METILYAYQMSPGSDELLWFATTQEECQAAAIVQRGEMVRDGIGVLSAMAVYRFVFRDMTPAELVAVLNCEKSVIDVAAVDRRLVAVVAD